MNKAKGKPKRFEGEISTLSVQMPKDLAERYDLAAKMMRMSKSQFGQYLFEVWIAGLDSTAKKLFK